MENNTLLQSLATPMSDILDALQPDVDFSKDGESDDRQSIGTFDVKPIDVVLAEEGAKPLPKMLFGQLWYENQLSILFADTNVGKTILAYQIADALSKGESAMGMDNQCEAQRVLYCDFEMSSAQLRMRFEQDGVRYNFSHNLLRVAINPEHVSDLDPVEEVKQSLMNTLFHTGAHVLIIDNIGWLNEDNETTTMAMSLMKWLHDLTRNGVSILVLAHTPKRDATRALTINDLAGSRVLANYADGIFAIGKSARDAGLRYIKELKQRNVALRYDSENVLVCEIVKENAFTRFAFVQYGDERVHLDAESQSAQYEREHKVAAARRLCEQGKTQREIATQLGISLGAVNKYLRNQH